MNERGQMLPNFLTSSPSVWEKVWSTSLACEAHYGALGGNLSAVSNRANYRSEAAQLIYKLPEITFVKNFARSEIFRQKNYTMCKVFIHCKGASVYTSTIAIHKLTKLGKMYLVWPETKMTKNVSKSGRWSKYQLCIASQTPRTGRIHQRLWDRLDSLCLFYANLLQTSQFASDPSCSNWCGRSLRDLLASLII